MRKNTFYTAVLLLAGTVLTACSGGDDVTSDITPVSQPAAEAGDVVELSGTLGSKGDVTRAIASDGTGTWVVGDQFAVYYETANGHASTVATVNSVNSDGSANFTATLRSPKTGDNSVKLVYPASAHNGEGGFKTDGLMNQGGTLEYINQNGLDIETATTTMNVEGMTAKLTSDVTLQPQVCLHTLNLTNGYYYENNLSTKLEISDGTHNYTIIPASATNSFTIAMLPVTDAKFTFTATTTKERSSFTKLDDVTLDNCTADNVGDVFDKDGIIYKVSSGPGAIYSKNYNSNKTLVAGKFYKSSFSLSAVTVNSPGVAMIAYVGEKGSVETNTNYRGLAIAMGECNQSNTTGWPSSEPMPDHANWCSQKTATCTTEYSDEVTDACTWTDGITMTDNLVNHASHTHWAAKAARNYKTAHPSSTSEWFLASLGQWQLIIQGLITKVDNMSQPYTVAINTTNNNKMNASYIGSVLIKAGAGATSGNPNGLENCYWSSSEYNAEKDWIVNFSYGRAGTQDKVTSFPTHVRPVLAF